VVVEQTWLDSYVAHAPMEPHAAVAAVEAGKVTVWAGTQTPFPLKNQVMQALKLPADKVRVITPYVGGGFGGKSASRQGVEAARLALLTGSPCGCSGAARKSSSTTRFAGGGDQDSVRP